MNDVSESGHQPRESTIDKNDISDGLLKDSCSSRCGIAKVTLRIPFKPESFKAQSLLARFHSSRKSDSGIKSEFKASSGGSGLGFGRGWRRQKTGNGFEVAQNAVAEPGNTSASLPDDLNQNTQVARSEGCCIGGDNGVGAASDELDTAITRCLSEEVSLSPMGGQRDAEKLFGTWPGRPRKLKSLRKRLLTSGSSSRNHPDNVPAAKTRESRESKETFSLLPRAMGTRHWDDPSIAEKTKTDLEDGTGFGMSSKAPEVAGQYVSLDALLESLPLIYNPTTKQLCLGTFKKGQNESKGKGMSGKAPSDVESDLNTEKQKLGSSKKYTEIGEQSEESQEEGFSNNSGELCEAPTLPKALEIIQEVEESGETVKLIDKGSSPQSGNVSGSSSLERGNYESLRNCLQRVGTSNSLSITDASSFSSLSSLNTELSASDSAVCLGSHQSDTGSLRDFVLTDNDGKSKKRGIADFLSRLSC